MPRRVRHLLVRTGLRGFTALVTSIAGSTDPLLTPILSATLLQAAPLYRARAIYAYTATTAEELSIEEDEPLLIFEADEGDEWVLARRVAEPEQLGGYVPATYVQEEEGTAGEEGFNGDAVDEVRACSSRCPQAAATENIWS